MFPVNACSTVQGKIYGIKRHVAWPPPPSFAAAPRLRRGEGGGGDAPAANSWQRGRSDASMDTSSSSSGANGLDEEKARAEGLLLWLAAHKKRRSSPLIPHSHSILKQIPIRMS